MDNFTFTHSFRLFLFKFLQMILDGSSGCFITVDWKTCQKKKDIQNYGLRNEES
jgi:hypothetical protein